MPQWIEREADYSPFKTVSSQVFLALSAIGFLCIVCIMVLLFVWSDMPQVKSASLVFLQIILVGFLFGFTSTALWTDTVTTVSCNVQIWLLVLGYDLFIASILAKNYRVYLLFKDTSSLAQMNIPNWQLLLTVGVSMLPDLIVCAIWSGGFTPTALKILPDEYRLIESYYYCTSAPIGTYAAEPYVSTADYAFVGFLGAYKGLQTLVAVVLAFLLRKVWVSPSIPRPYLHLALPFPHHSLLGSH